MTDHTLAHTNPIDVEPGQTVAIDAVAAVELIEALEFCCDWFDRDRSRLDASLFRFNGGGYDLAALRGDLRRLADQLGHAPLNTTRPTR